MTFRAPRRRISPRTKRRYRAIKDFLRRALGGVTYQPDIKINSSIAVNVTEFKRQNRAASVELDSEEVCSQDDDVDDLDESQDKVPRRSVITTDHETQVTADCTPEQKHAEKNNKADDHSSSTAISNYMLRYSEPQVMNSKTTRAEYSSLPKLKRHSEDGHRKCKDHMTRSVYDNDPLDYSNVDAIPITLHRSDEPKHHLSRRDDRIPREYTQIKHKTRHKSHSPSKKTDDKPKKSKPRSSQLDPDFIADLIQKQYKPLKLVGRRHSGFSQFSAPVCRDQEFVGRESILEVSELPCCYDGPPKQYKRSHGLTDMQSLCDTRLYSSRKHSNRRNRQMCFDDYIESRLDFIPVKEKSSPKSRKKFIQEVMSPYDYYREVPPSPRTQRPRLNLRAQSYKNHDEIIQQPPKVKRKPSRKYQAYVDVEDSDLSTIGNINTRTYINNINKVPKCKDKSISMSENAYCNDMIDTNICPEPRVDKTDKALSEIKDLLQSFLLEIKKENNTPLASVQSDNLKFENLRQEPKPEEHVANTMCHEQTGFNSCVMPPCSVPSPYIAPHSNPCCYPILPVCPLNYQQNSCVVPTASFTCQTCATNKAENTTNKSTKSNCDNETELLIKEIYKLVTHSPRFSKESSQTRKNLTSRSVGGSKIEKQNAKVGTPTTKCYSKSCEAIGSRIITDPYYIPNASYSDTIVEKLSLESDSGSTGPTSEFIDIDKTKNSKFANVLRSMGFFKKKKPVIKQSLSDTTLEVDVKVKKPSPPFRQEVMDYAMYDQNYYHRHPHMHHRTPPPRHPEPYYHYERECSCPSCTYSSSNRVHPRSLPHSSTPRCCMYPPHQHMPPPPPPPPPHASPYATHNPYPSQHHEPPLCLKEIEVRSMGTQSESKRMTSFLQKFGRKTSPVFRRDDPKPIPTQTAGRMPSTKVANRPFWAKAMNPDTVGFSYNTQKNLKESDNKMRNMMNEKMKKLFVRSKNPFSPNNIFLNSILQKDTGPFKAPAFKTPSYFKHRKFM